MEPLCTGLWTPSPSGAAAPCFCNEGKGPAHNFYLVFLSGGGGGGMLVALGALCTLEGISQ